MANELHPIQLQGIRVLELHLDVFDPNKADEDGIDLPFIFTTGHSAFNAEMSLITVGVKGEVGNIESKGKHPFHIKAHIQGQFSVNTEKFPIDKIEDWAEKNAPLILLPFLREHIYGLASRAGIKEVLVPLFVVPTFKLTTPN